MCAQEVGHLGGISAKSPADSFDPIIFYISEILASFQQLVKPFPEELVCFLGCANDRAMHFNLAIVKQDLAGVPHAIRDPAFFLIIAEGGNAGLVTDQSDRGFHTAAGAAREPGFGGRSVETL